jgi:quercetin dioxygenase-like cupin family protein
MHVAEVGTHPRRSPSLGGPSAEPLITTGISELIGVIHLEIPAGAAIPEHDHGASQIVVIPLTGSLELSQGEHRRPLSKGMAAHIGLGERVGLANRDVRPATVMVIASPPEFADRIAASWPTQAGSAH